MCQNNKKVPDHIYQIRIGIVTHFLLIFALFPNVLHATDTTVSQVIGGDSDVAQPITKEQAISMAEQFIKVQGYTSEGSTLPKEEIVFESLEWTSDADKILERRKGSLEPKAVGVKVGWIVGFRHTGAPEDSKTGRAVSMDAYGKHLRVQHQEVYLSIFKEVPTVERVIDGSTIKLSDGRTVRLIGVDCPEFKDHDRNRRNAERLGINFEHYEGYAQKSKDFVRELVGKEEVGLEFDEVNKSKDHKGIYGRTLAYVYRYGRPYSEWQMGEGWVVESNQGEEQNQQRIFVNATLVNAGYCTAYTRFDFKYKEQFVELEQEAKEQRRGIWSSLK